jgi:hypothetical protein
MVAAAQGLELSKADSVVPKLKPSTVMKRAKRELTVLRLCGGYVHWRN